MSTNEDFPVGSFLLGALVILALIVAFWYIVIPLALVVGGIWYALKYEKQQKAQKEIEPRMAAREQWDQRHAAIRAAGDAGAAAKEAAAVKKDRKRQEWAAQMHARFTGDQIKILEGYCRRFKDDFPVANTDFPQAEHLLKIMADEGRNFTREQMKYLVNHCYKTLAPTSHGEEIQKE
jgi:hypothetical protein